MILRMSEWEKIREEFTEMEKKMLNEAIVGETICPRGCVIDEDKAASIGVKVKNLLRIANEA